MKSEKNNIQIVGGDLNAELGPGVGVETYQCWGAHTQRGKQERRLDEAMADDTKLHSTKQDEQKKRLKSKLPTGPRQCTEKQLDCMLVDRNICICSRDAEANDMIHKGSDHRSVVAHFVITTPEKEVSQKKAHRQEEIQDSRELKEPR